MRKRLLTASLVTLALLPAFLNGWYNPIISRTPALFWQVELLTWVVLPLTLLAIGLRLRLFTLAELGYSRCIRGNPSAGWLIIICIVVVFIDLQIDPILFDAAVRLFGYVPPEGGFTYNQMIPPSGPKTGLLRLLAVLYLSLSAGLVEELIHRAMLRRLFPEGVVGAVAFILVSSVTFSAMHWEGGNYKLAYTFMGGLFFATTYVATGNLWPPTLAHIAIDFEWFSSI